MIKQVDEKEAPGVLPFDSQKDSDYFQIKFIYDKARFARLVAFFNKLKAVKNGEVQDDWGDIEDICSDEIWSEFLDDEAVEWFAGAFDTDGVEGQVYHKLWELTKPKIRVSHPFFIVPGSWDLESILDAIFNCEYDLIQIEAIEGSEEAVLYYNPHAQPFGGTESLVQLLEAFGCRVTYDTWHEGSHRKIEGTWDFEKAKKLVEQNKGVTG